MISPDLQRAYETTRYVVEAGADEIGLRIGMPASELTSVFSRFGVSEAVFLTAYNPFSRTTSPEENKRNQAALRRDLESISVGILDGRGEGTIAEWPPEPSFLALGLTRELAQALGRKYGQNAIVWVGQDTIPLLIVLR